MIYFTGNIAYLPINNSNKFVCIDLHGLVYLNEIVTLEEILAKSEVKTAKDLHEYIEKWGKRN